MYYLTMYTTWNDIRLVMYILFDFKLVWVPFKLCWYYPCLNHPHMLPPIICTITTHYIDSYDEQQNCPRHYPDIKSKVVVFVPILSPPQKDHIPSCVNCSILVWFAIRPLRIAYILFGWFYSTDIWTHFGRRTRTQWVFQTNFVFSVQNSFRVCVAWECESVCDVSIVLEPDWQTTFSVGLILNVCAKKNVIKLRVWFWLYHSELELSDSCIRLRLWLIAC